MVRVVSDEDAAGKMVAVTKKTLEKKLKKTCKKFL